MSKLTEEQQLAVDKSHTNIIVSAGAGSGKTTVLKTRVLRELKEGVNVNNLIILTFTNNAASEMKERIRKVIDENPEVKEQAELIDSAYITTFDSFAQSLVKKYNYLLNIDSNFSIVDTAIVNTEIKKILDNIFEEYYESNNDKFKALIEDFCIKDDKQIRMSIIDIYKKLANLINMNEYLDEYIDKYYSTEYVDSLFLKYENLVFKLRDDIITLLDALDDETDNQEKLEANLLATASFRNASSYDELIDCIDFKLADARGNIYTDLGRDIKKKITIQKNKLKEYLSTSKSELITRYFKTKKYAEIIIEIIKELDKRIMKFKELHNAYEFNDIALLAIKLVKENIDVRNEIKNNTYEIMIDEYQDTNDIQETFISYIENNNVYMVGDIKQSIYRFRNANPYIFKKKYDDYKNGLNGFKIDLNKNFRSRNEVIDNINLIFSLIMSDDIGGANYKQDHSMVFGNTSYNDHAVNNNYDMEILNYKIEDKKYNEIDTEAFIIADDILKRINNHEQVVYYEKGEMKTRDITFEDFVILVDKGKNFETIKKILESKGIQSTIDKDISIKDEDEIYILKNLINLIICIKDNRLDIEFKHCYLSIARSYIYKMTDEEIFEIFVNNDFINTNLYKKCLELSNILDGLSNKEILMKIIHEFNIFEKLITVGDIDERLTKLEYFVNNAISLNDFGMDIYDMSKYFDELLNSEEDIKMSSITASSNSVKIMTIHKSKGLEYNYVYLPYLGSNFTKSGFPSLFKYSSKFGFILPFFDNGKGDTFINAIEKQDDLIEELSERIRLLYVALTRAKEKVILINSYNEKIEPIINDMTYSDMLEVRSYRDILSLIKEKVAKYVIDIDLDTLGINKEYNQVKSYNYIEHIKNSNKIIQTENIKIDNELLDNKHFSKSLSKVMDKDLKERLDFGTYMHYLFEVYDFKNNNLEILNIDDKAREKILNFLKHEEVKNIHKANIFKEHEILFESNGSTYHGFIDLLLEYDDHFDIIDYKLSNIENDEYKVQLTGYKNYIESKYGKPTNIYLYSINKDIFKKLN